MALAQVRYDTEDDYYNIPEDVRAELINGHLIYNMAAPTSTHQLLLMELAGTIREYIRSRNGKCRVVPAPFAVKLKEERATIVEPDISVICDPDKITQKGCTGAPDWIIEIISPGNASHDYVTKLNLYAETGVREYWIVDPMKKKIFVYHLENSHFDVETYTFEDRIKAGIYDDLEIDFPSFDIPFS